MQPPPLPIKYWRRIKYRYDTIMLKPDLELACSLGFSRLRSPHNMLFCFQDLENWWDPYALFFGDPDGYQQQHQGWELECVKHCKHDSDSPWHEFLLLEWRHVQSQAFIFIKLERQAGEKTAEVPRHKPATYVLSTHQSRTSVPRSMESSRGQAPEEPSGPLVARDRVGFFRSMSQMGEDRPFVVLASFAPAKGSKSLLSFRDVLSAAMACRELSNKLYDFRYMC